MDLKPLFDSISSAIPDLKIYLNHPLAPYTTIRIGGPADLFIIVEKDYQLRTLVKLLYQNHVNFSENNSKNTNINNPKTNVSVGAFSGAQDASDSDKAIPLTILGNGSNVVISDAGIRGIVIKIATTDVKIDPTLSQDIQLSTTISTQRAENDSQKYLDFSQLDYDETSLPQKKVTLSAGLLLPRAINELIDQGLTGLQWFGYIPATIGGAVYSNIHGGSHNFSEFVDSVEIFNFKNGVFENLKNKELDWHYDHSSFQSHPEWLIISVTLKLFVGDPKKARLVVDTWIHQKQKVQSMNSAGSVFKNPSLIDCQRLWGEQKSAGWIIDQVLELKGHSEGDAQISNKHANFIVNNGHATASEYIKIVKKIQALAKQKLNLDLEPEIKLLGQF